MPQPNPDFAKLCCDACKLAQQSAKAANLKFGWDDIERIIRQLDEGHIPTKSTPRPQSSNPSPFGDRKVIPPSPEQVTLYSASIGYPMDGEGWCDAYQQKGWLVGKAKMKDWQSAVRVWKRNKWGLGTITLNGAGKEKQKDDYQKF